MRSKWRSKLDKLLLDPLAILVWQRTLKLCTTCEVSYNFKNWPYLWPKSMFWEVKIEVIVRWNFPKCMIYHPNIRIIPKTDPKFRLEDCIMKIHKIDPWPPKSTHCASVFRAPLTTFFISTLKNKDFGQQILPDIKDTDNVHNFTSWLFSLALLIRLLFASP